MQVKTAYKNKLIPENANLIPQPLNSVYDEKKDNRNKKELFWHCFMIFILCNWLEKSSHFPHFSPSWKNLLTKVSAILPANLQKCHKACLPTSKNGSGNCLPNSKKVGNPAYLSQKKVGSAACLPPKNGGSHCLLTSIKEANPAFLHPKK